MSFPTSCRTTDYARGPLHQLINNETFLLTVPFDLDEPFAVGCDDGGVKSKLFLIQREKPQYYGHEMQPCWFISNFADPIPPSLSNSHSRKNDPQRVKPRTKRRVS